MLSTEELCNHLIHLLHAPIRWYDQQKKTLSLCENDNQSEDPVSQDPPFQEFLLILLILV